MQNCKEKHIMSKKNRFFLSQFKKSSLFHLKQRSAAHTTPEFTPCTVRLYIGLTSEIQISVVKLTAFIFSNCGTNCDDARLCSCSSGKAVSETYLIDGRVYLHQVLQQASNSDIYP